MKKSVVSIFALLVCVAGYSQNSKSFYNNSYESRNSGSFDKSAALLSFGLGFPNLASGFGGLSGFPPIYAKYEHGFLRDEVGLGGVISTGFGSVNSIGGKNSFGAFSFAILGYYHFNKLIPIEKMDVYAGLGFGGRSVTYSNDGAQNVYGSSNDFLVIGRLGIRYFIKEKFAFYAETGSDGMSSINFGVTLKLK